MKKKRQREEYKIKMEEDANAEKEPKEVFKMWRGKKEEKKRE